MTKAELQGLVQEGFSLAEQIKALEAKLDGIKEVIVAHANGNVLEIQAEGCKATVNYSARIVSRVDAGDLAKVKKVSGDYFEKLFCYAPVDKFRDVAKALLGDAAEKLTGLLSGVPAPRVSFRKV